MATGLNNPAITRQLHLINLAKIGPYFITVVTGHDLFSCASPQVPPPLGAAPPRLLLDDDHHLLAGVFTDGKLRNVPPPRTLGSMRSSACISAASSHGGDLPHCCVLTR
jgi:hypothetical protein